MVQRLCAGLCSTVRHTAALDRAQRASMSAAFPAQACEEILQYGDQVLPAKRQISFHLETTGSLDVERSTGSALMALCRGLHLTVDAGFGRRDNQVQTWKNHQNDKVLMKSGL
nr:hypothetical protein CFP56_52789 [Quercus suber]